MAAPGVAIALEMHLLNSGPQRRRQGQRHAAQSPDGQSEKELGRPPRLRSAAFGTVKCDLHIEARCPGAGRLRIFIRTNDPRPELAKLVVDHDWEWPGLWTLMARRPHFGINGATQMGETLLGVLLLIRRKRLACVAEGAD
jgi:hypothetical protein